jgi:uncharacterized membrane protein YhaH (DUF805 family)
MDFAEAVKICLTKFVDFNGRASRSEFWWFMLFLVIANFFLSFIPVVGFIFAIVSLVPSMAAGARRLHDIDKSGWLVLIGLIPLVSLILIYFFIQPSDGSNQYGPVPVATA